MTRLVPGTASQRSAVAWSCHIAALMVYGWTPGEGACFAVSPKIPVADSFRGKSDGDAALSLGTSR